MKVAQIVPCLGNRSGGPSRSVYNLSQGLRELGLLCDIITCNYQDDENIAPEDWIKVIELPQRRVFEYAPGFLSLLQHSQYDLLHIHSIYTYPVTIAAFWAKRNNIPYIIAPRGSLYPKALSSGSSRGIKKIFNKLVLTPLFNNSSVIHATSIEEMEVIRNLGYSTPIAVIPNSVPMEAKKRDVLQTPNRNIFRLGYIGRINPIKNLDGLLRAWSECGMGKNENAELVIVGGTRLSVEIEYLRFLHNLESKLGISNIKWTGTLDGEEKGSELSSFSFLILPSHSENFGMVVLEALIQGVPAIASQGTPWRDLEKSKAGYWVSNDDRSLSNAIMKAYGLSDAQKKEMSKNASLLAENTYSMAAVSNKLLRLYEWIVCGGDTPDFVYE